MTINHKKQWKFLEKSVELGKIPHAFLFSGQDSIGKTTFALEFIKLVNCQSQTERPCGKCRSCSDIDKKTHPDLFIIKPEEGKEIKISQIRNLNSKLSLRSYSAPFKAIIIDQAHFLNQEAQSAFLKLLEEPKGKTIFILISQYPDMLLPTILSRVERLKFYSPFQKKTDIETAKEISKISKADLASRFQYAKELTGEDQDAEKTLDSWLSYFREKMILTANNKNHDYPQVKLNRIIKTIQTTQFLISTTNVNTRLALEMLMLEL